MYICSYEHSLNRRKLANRRGLATVIVFVELYIKLIYISPQVIFTLILSIDFLIIRTSGFPSGAPIEACGDVVPDHVPHNASDSEDLLYTVLLHSFETYMLRNTYLPGEPYSGKFS